MSSNDNVKVDPNKDVILGAEQKSLVADVLAEGSFDPENNPIDASVLYETTGFRTSLGNEAAFWHDFFFDYGENADDG